MTTVALIESIVQSIKTVYTNTTGIDNLYVANVIDSARESVLIERSMSGDKTIPSQLLQYFDIYYDSSIQVVEDDSLYGEYATYSIPQLAQIGSVTAPITIMKTKGVAYPVYTSLQMYESMNRNSHITGKDSIVLINNSVGNQIRLYGERRDTLRAQGVLSSPMKLETFNPYFDEYPVTGNMVKAIELNIMNLYMKNLQAQAPRFIRDGGVK